MLTVATGIAPQVWDDLLITEPRMIATIIDVLDEQHQGSSS